MAAKEHYALRSSELEKQLTNFERLDARIGSIRLALGATFLLMLWICFGARVLSPAWIWLPVAAFIALVIYHARLRESKAATQRGAQHYRQSIARLEDRWSGTVPSG